jgi:hypothetical protein
MQKEIGEKGLSWTATGLVHAVVASVEVASWRAKVTVADDLQ